MIFASNAKKISIANILSILVLKILTLNKKAISDLLVKH